MEQIFYFAISNPKSKEHFTNTVLSGVELSRIESFLSDEDRTVLLTLYSGGPLRIWGSEPGGRNLTNWNNMNFGDIILVYEDSFFRYGAVIVHKLRSKRIGEKIWVHDGGKFELIYFIKSVTGMDVPVREFNKEMSYSENWHPQGFGNVVSGKLTYINRKYGSALNFINSISTKDKIIREDNESISEIYRIAENKDVIETITKKPIEIIPDQDLETDEYDRDVLYGEPIDFRGLRHAPVNEQGVVFLFGKISDDLGIKIEAIRTAYPDCEGKRLVDRNRNLWKKVYIEFEFNSRNFLTHGHNPKKCDIIVCWNDDWANCPIEVIELKKIIKQLS